VQAGALYLVLHEAQEAVVDPASQQVLLTVAKTEEVLLGDIDAAPLGVFVQVTQDVGELEGDAQIDGVFAGLALISMAEDMDADEAHRGGYQVAISPQLLEGGVALDGEVRYGEADLQMVSAGLHILQQGFPFGELLRLAIGHARQVGRTADHAVSLFDRYVRKAGKSVGADDVTDAFRRLLPTVITLVALHFQRTLLSRALKRLRAHGTAEAYEAAAAALQAGHLEVKWR